MTEDARTRYCTAFRGSRQIAAGALEQVTLKLIGLATNGHAHGVLVFDDATAQQIDVDLRGTPAQVLQRLSPLSPGLGSGSATSDAEHLEIAGRVGRPKLGVVAREVTLLPRHWDWLSQQSGGASVALRKLVDEARRTSLDKDTIRQSQEAAYRFMSAIAGNQQDFEEAARALFARDQLNFEASTESWPPDIRKHVKKLAAPALQEH
jgi:hypothetical protein